MDDRLHFNQDVDTPRGPGTFIAYFSDAPTCQVAIKKHNGYCVNVEMSTKGITPRKATAHAKPKPQPIIHTVDVAFI